MPTSPKKRGRTRVALLAANDIPGGLTVEAAKSFAAENRMTLTRIEQFDPDCAKSDAPSGDYGCCTEARRGSRGNPGAQLITGLRALSRPKHNVVPYMLNYASMNMRVLVAAEIGCRRRPLLFCDEIIRPGRHNGPCVFKARSRAFDAAFDDFTSRPLILSPMSPPTPL